MRTIKEETQKQEETKQAASLAETITFGELSEQYCAAKKSQVVPMYWRYERDRFKRGIAPFLANKRLIDITVADIQEAIFKDAERFSTRNLDTLSSTYTASL